MIGPKITQHIGDQAQATASELDPWSIGGRCTVSATLGTVRPGKEEAALPCGRALSTEERECEEHLENSTKPTVPEPSVICHVGIEHD